MNELIPFGKDELNLIERSFLNIREEIKDNPYIIEGIHVLKTGGLRSAIGNFWNAVIDDLRNKIIHRSLELFNKSVSLRREIKDYEDFQEFVNDDELIEGAYKIGVISWEAKKVLKHAKETRHIFDGHPKSSQPSPIKVLSMMDDCIKYVLNVEYPPQIINIDEYVDQLGTTDFDRNKFTIENALGDLPEVYKNELAHRLYRVYVHEGATSTMQGNIEFVLPILWKVLPKKIKIDVVRHVDREITSGNKSRISSAFEFIDKADAIKYLSLTGRKYLIEPLIEELEKNLDNWEVETKIVKALEPYSAVIPDELVDKYVAALTLTFVGVTGASSRFQRTNFFANGAASRIPDMFAKFNDHMATAFIETVQNNSTLRHRVRNPVKLRRLRTLATIVSERVSERFEYIAFLNQITDEEKEKEFYSNVLKGEYL